MNAIDAIGCPAELHIRGRIDRDDRGIYLIDTTGRRWNLQWDDTVEVAA